MKKAFCLLALFCFSSLSGARPFEDPVLHSPRSAVLNVDRDVKWEAGLSYENEKRVLIGSGAIRQPHKLTANRYGAYLSHSPLSWLALIGGAGASVAELDGKGGEYGLDWLVGSRIGLFEYALKSLPLRGVTHFLRVDFSADFRRAQSNFSDVNFYWQELRLMPSLTYIETLPINHGYDLLHPESAALHAGLVFSQVNSKLGGNSLGENRNFGVRLGADVRLANLWTIYADVISFHSSETSFTAGFKRRY